MKMIVFVKKELEKPYHKIVREIPAEFSTQEMDRISDLLYEELNNGIILDYQIELLN